MQQDKVEISAPSYAISVILRKVKAKLSPSF
jgi:hypothetical protein